TVRAGLRCDGPRLTGRYRRWTLKDPVFGPVPAIRVAADDPSASIKVVVGRVGIEANGHRVEAAVGQRAGHYGAGQAQAVACVAPAIAVIGTDLRLLLFPDQGGH